MSQASQVRTYHRAASVVFLKTNERFGGLSNMAPGFPLRVNGVRIRTSEALYQACRFPHMPEVQQLIIGENSPMTAKMRSKPYRRVSRHDWDFVRVKIMRWCLRVKLAQNWREFGRLLLATGDRPIVEQSRKDDFWGAKVADDGTLVGMNVLGRLLMELREQLKGDEAESLRFIEPLAISEFLLFGQPIEAVQAAPNAEIPGWTTRRPSHADTAPPQPSDPQPSLFEQPMITETKPADSNPHIEAASGRNAPARFPQYRESGLPWLGEIPAHWDVRRNGRLFAERVETGFEELPILEVSLRTGVRVRDMENGTRKQQMADRSKYKRAAKGDIAYNMMRMWQGAVGVAPTDGLISPAYVVARPFPEVEPRYYAYLFRTDAYKREVNKFSRGIVSDRNRLYWDEFKQMPSSFPPTEEQSLIADFLDAHGRLTARLIRNKRRLIGLLNEQKQAIINRAVTRGLNPDAPMKPTGIDWMPEVPAHWEVIPLRHLSTCLDGRRVPLEASAREKMLGDIPYWGANQIIDHLNDFLFDEDLILLGEDGAPFFDRNKPVAFFSQGKVWPNNHIHVLRPKPGNRPEFIVHALNCADYTNYVGGATRDKLTQSYMKAIPIPVPPKDEQDVILDRLTQECTPLETTAERAAREIGFIQEYRERLIADVVTGKLDVRHIEIAAPADEPTADEDDALEEDLEGDDAEVMEGADADD
ncbi:NADAR domain-containing protein [Defluviimonas salinarum]|uniref:NADAR domain-containing protein n=1 Tax=Defluviimonas salinarum TaxID=2992147 RepID=A0ABT3IY46_9RHOB|nr:NADAR domain-containing protein [Defluviimonas salinarum]MCW3780353.1 NADAR domain-containing protein [Defluviimonas salinarum]